MNTNQKLIPWNVGIKGKLNHWIQILTWLWFSCRFSLKKQALGVAGFTIY